MITSIRRGVAVTALVAVALVATACGDDDSDDASDDATAASGGLSGDSGERADVSAYCTAELAMETAPAPDIDFESDTPEEQAAALRDYANATLRPLADDIIAAAPDELAGAIDVQDEALTQLQADGDSSALEQPDVVAAQAESHAYDLENCGWSSVPVSAAEYAFDGLPDQLDAGVVSFEFTNQGEQVHELLLFRKNDGVTDSIEDLLALPEDQAMSKLTMLGEPAFAGPGEEGYAVADLEPGNYAAICMIPTGMTSTDGPPPEGGPPHAMQGMHAEFTVS